MRAIRDSLLTVLLAIPCFWLLRSNSVRSEQNFTLTNHGVSVAWVTQIPTATNALKHDFRLCKIDRNKHITNFCSTYAGGADLSSYISCPITSRDENNQSDCEALSVSKPLAESNAVDDVTLITQLSFDRMYTIKLIAAKWNGPIIYIVYFFHENSAEMARRNLSVFVRNSRMLTLRHNIEYRAVVSVANTSTLYPINVLRNVGLRLCTTKFVLVIDADFLPKPGMYDDVRRWLAKLRKRTDDTMFVVPAFETSVAVSRKTLTDIFPANKRALLTLWRKARQIKPFHVDTFAPGHAPTDYRRWEKTETPYFVRWGGCFEPYLLAKANLFAEFDGRFVGYGLNKIQKILQLAVEGVKFAVLPDVFLIHVPHASSSAHELYLQNYRAKSCTMQSFFAFLSDLDNDVNHYIVREYVKQLGCCARLCSTASQAAFSCTSNLCLNPW